MRWLVCCDDAVREPTRATTQKGKGLDHHMVSIATTIRMRGGARTRKYGTNPRADRNFHAHFGPTKIHLCLRLRVGSAPGIAERTQGSHNERDREKMEGVNGSDKQSNLRYSNRFRSRFPFRSRYPALPRSARPRCLGTGGRIRSFTLAARLR